MAEAEAFVAIAVWAIWKADTADDSYDTHLILKCLKGRFCEEGTAWNLDGCKEDYSHRVVSVVDPSSMHVSLPYPIQKLRQFFRDRFLI